MSSEPIRDPVKDHLLTPQNWAFVIIDYQPVVRNNSRRGHVGVRHLQKQADSGMMSTCCSGREQSSESSRTS